MTLWAQLAASIALATFFSVLTFSRARPMAIAMLIPLGGGWLVLASLGWSYLVMTTSYERGAAVFRFGFDPLLPALITYGSMALAMVLGISILASLFWQRDHSLRQRISYAFAALAIIWHLSILSLLPWRLQKLLDWMDIAHP